LTSDIPTQEAREKRRKVLEAVRQHRRKQYQNFLKKMQLQADSDLAEMATKADMQDLDAKLVKRVNSHKKRIDDLKKEAGYMS
jgi:hypothetical protein